MDISEALRLVQQRLAEAGVDEPRRDARALVAHVAGRPVAAIAAASGAVDGPALEAALARRAAREPMAFIEGFREFYSLPFAVSPATLIPRPDSEILVDAVLRETGAGAGAVLDLGTGTGCLLLAVLHARPAMRGLGIDRIAAACHLARRNAAALGMSARTLFVAADWASALDPAARFTAILANPPYIPAGDVPGLMPEVALHEPRSALDGGPDGLAAYRSLAPVIARHLAPGGIAALEIGCGQAAAVCGILQQQALAVTVVPDLSGTERVVLARHGSEKPFGSAVAHR